jgi:prepilin-type N-terminal cleavage/methylation domain-containing protein
MARNLLLKGFVREGTVAVRTEEQKGRGGQGGFSLIELVIAMTVTLIITGAVFQLSTAGQTAFRKEPALADRQQNIRVAMDVISQDIYKAGFGIPEFAQVFSDALNGVGPTGPSGAKTDEIQMFMASECPALRVCEVTGEAGKSLTTYEPFSSCYNLPAVVLMGGDQSPTATPEDKQKWALRWADDPGGGTSASCSGGGTKNGHAKFPPGQAPLVNPTGGFNGWYPEYMVIGQMVRYRINIDSTGVPNLERSPVGGQNDIDGNSTWQIVARGVEDLQVQYENGTGWHDTPGTITCGANCASPAAADYNSLIRRVRVRLSARSTTQNLTGQSTSSVGSAVRGQLSSDIAPRTAAATLGLHNGEL